LPLPESRSDIEPATSLVAMGAIDIADLLDFQDERRRLAVVLRALLSRTVSNF
jgi:hypothetical protein